MEATCWQLYKIYERVLTALHTSQIMFMALWLAAIWDVLLFFFDFAAFRRRLFADFAPFLALGRGAIAVGWVRRRVFRRLNK